MKKLAVFAVLLGGHAFAQGRPSVVDYPLDVKASVTEAQVAELQDDFRQLLARNSGILVPTRTAWKMAVAAHKRQDCEIRDECLQQLAISAGTLYALYASVERNVAGTEFTATGRIVNQDGVQVRAPVQAKLSKKKTAFADGAKAVLAELLTRLQLEKLSSVLAPKEVKKVEPIAEQKPADVQLFTPPPTPPAEAAPTALRPFAWVAGGLALASGGVAAGFGLTAMSARAGLPSDGRLLDESQARAQASVNRGATIALASGIAAVALAGVSATMFVLSAPSPGSALSVAVAPGGAAMTLSGRF
jgi:hypothetical protein